mmetsp:Transcript_14934/g.21930  ORF Transcript_14934/g.21930 Transcript_14934/m.21930 type:complete len:260 (+) Transcript_14934:66-845(+)
MMNTEVARVGGDSSSTPPSHPPVVYAVRHAQSVANSVKEADRVEYYKRCWLDDSTLPADRRLRDCVLTPEGAAATLSVALDPKEESSESSILIVVSPLTRALLTACLLFHRLQTVEGVRVLTVVEPAAVERLNAPHDIVENVGRQVASVFEEIYPFLLDVEAPPGAVALARALEASCQDLAQQWWFSAAEPGQLPQRVLESGVEERRERLRECIKRHVRDAGCAVSRVFVVCHWGVLFTLTGVKGAANLESVEVKGFLD